MPAKDSSYLSISTWTIIRFFLVAIAIVALYLVRDILAALIFAVIVASAIEPVIEWLKRYRIPRILAVVLIYCAIGFAFFFLIYLIVPLLLEEVHTLSTGYPVLQEQIRRGLAEAESLPFFPDLQLDPGALFTLPDEYVTRLGGGVISFVSAVFGGIFSFVLVIVFSFYLAAQERGIESFLRLVTPLRHEAYTIDLWERSQRKLGRWFRSQVLLGAIVGILIFFGLTLLGVPNALLFAIIAGMFEIIPVVGPILAAVPAVIVALLEAPLLGLFTAGLYVVVQQTESHVIVPVIMRRAVGLSPLIVVLALVIGGTLGGIFGILLAVPLTVIGAELLDDWDKKKRALMPE
ncbi:MAG: AI-2E family transporter [Patescibacteria group bacterium]